MAVPFWYAATPGFDPHRNAKTIVEIAVKMEIASIRQLTNKNVT